VTFSTSKRTSPRRGTERATPEPLLFLNPVDARAANVMMMMSDDDDDDYDANERTLSRWRARISFCSLAGTGILAVDNHFEENFGGDSDKTFEHFRGLPAELSFRHGKQRAHTG